MDVLGVMHYVFQSCAALVVFLTLIAVTLHSCKVAQGRIFHIVRTVLPHVDHKSGHFALFVKQEVNTHVRTFHIPEHTGPMNGFHAE